MRLRSRPRRSRDGAAPGAPFDAWTPVGNLDTSVRVQVDRAGRVFAPGRSWTLDWWIGAEDRWHRPVQEAAVRQGLVGASPVVETRVRIPSGDAVSRVYGARGPGAEDLLVVEVQNDSKLPFALALVVEPCGGAAVRDLALRGPALWVDDEPIWLARSPGRFALSTAAHDRTALEVVLAGDAEPVRSAAVSCADGGARGVLLFPLAHTATLRIAVPLDGAARPVDVAGLPSASQVASGWAAHSASAARVEVPDRRLREAVSASTRYLLLGAARDDASLATIAARWRFTGGTADPLAIAALVQTWTASESPTDRATGHLALPAIADLLDAMDEHRAAADVRTLHRSETPPTPPSDPYALLDDASPTWTWASDGAGHDPSRSAAFLLAVRDLLVDDAGERLALSPVVPDAWLGLGWEVHDLPTRFGRLSFAVRWHGDRPAVLWELEPSGPGTARLTAPAMDPSWSSTNPRGEALLAPVPVPERASGRRGLTIPVTIEPVRRRP
ncbi:MAG: hypothetical protein ACJ739_10930 [Acidimicrobiales bacterium]